MCESLKVSFKTVTLKPVTLKCCVTLLTLVILSEIGVWLMCHGALVCWKIENVVICGFEI